MPYLLDTNVISENMKLKGDKAALSWLEEHANEAYLSSVTVQELRYGVLRMPAGRKRRALESILGELFSVYREKIVPYDFGAAIKCAEFHEISQASGHNTGIEDMMIAGIAANLHMTLATRNTKDFDFLGIELVNPFA